MGNSSKKPNGEEVGEVKKMPLALQASLTLGDHSNKPAVEWSQDELDLLHDSFAFIKQNCHKIALKAIIRMVDTMPDVAPALEIGGKNMGESFSLMNQGLIFLTGLEKCVERANDPQKLRAYAKHINHMHSKQHQLKVHQMIGGLKAFEDVILECIQNGYQHRPPRRQSSALAIQLMQQHPSQRPRRMSIVGEQQPLQLLDQEHTDKCGICKTWIKFFNLLYVTFDPKHTPSDDNGAISSHNDLVRY